MISDNRYNLFIPTHVGPKLLLKDVGVLINWSQKFKAYKQERKPFRELENLLSHYEDSDAAFTQTAISYLLEQHFDIVTRKGF